MKNTSASSERERRVVRVRGLVQGVGMRPALYRLAVDLSLAGFVRNDAEGVWVELEGGRADVERFLEQLPRAAPAQARIDSIEVQTTIPRGDTAFHIVRSDPSGTPHALMPADSAPCEACLRELMDPADRRYRYPFINCTACGPRYTIVRDLPYDRARTSMAAFQLCSDCLREYEEPNDRRFHAEPNACPRCGPRMRLQSRDGALRFEDQALRAAAQLLRQGAIVAVKGVGGFLLAIDASHEEAVAKLRARKHRPHQPFAVMVRDLEEARRCVRLDEAATQALLSPARPIVLAPGLPNAPCAPSVAPGLTELGVFLPSTPLQHLLLIEGPPLQVMTSGNHSGEPMARTDAEALESLGDIADAFLLHDREILTTADDSVVRVVAGRARAVRRARGMVPEAVTLPFEVSGILALGAQQKNTVCLTRGHEAFVSQHLGDLSHLRSFALFEATIAHLKSLLGVQPRIVAHDLHPDYLSTRWALSSGLSGIPVQHHHAHIASCLAERSITEPVLGVAFDGTGCGPEGTLWGGELLAADLQDFQRLGHLRALPLPGGEAAIREPWRLAAAALLDAGEPLDLLHHIPEKRRSMLRELLSRGSSWSYTTSAGRWFDAMAALCGVRDAITYEAQAAVELEACCAPVEAAEPYRFELTNGALLELDLRPVVRAIAHDLRSGVEVSVIAARFHETLAAGVVEMCRAGAARTGLRRVALSGGCFQNRRLTERTVARLEAAGFEVLLHRIVPPNDGGISLGQAAVAACRISRGLA